MTWLNGDELRAGLGCMRLDEENAATVLAAALEAGLTIFDTARAYGESERLVGQALAHRRCHVISKGGMKREGSKWTPDGRARSLREDCEASLEALGGLPIDLYLVHAPDPRVPWATTVRALAQLLELKLVAHIGLSNVTRAQLDEALEIAPITAVQSPLDAIVRGGIGARCKEKGIEVMVHSPLGGPARAKRWKTSAEGATPQETVLATLVAEGFVPIAGATRADTARSIARAARLSIDTHATRQELGLAPRIAPESGAHVVLLMGLQGSGKSTKVIEYEGFERLNRDREGGTMKKLHRILEEKLASGSMRIVLDNTYASRAHRHDAITAARKHGACVTGVFIDVAMRDAQINVIERMLTVHGRLLEPGEMERAKDPASIPPNVLFRTARVLEVPDAGEGFSSLEIVRFARKPSTGVGARFVSMDAVRRDRSALGEGLAFVFGWNAKAPDLGSVPIGICPHGAGPPRCWCRPPLPGLLLAFAKSHNVDFGKSVVVGTSPAHRTMATALGAKYEDHT